ncbi:PucR family transcriptional regulator [Streptomyces thermolineatus]|uniref:PucR family transcriptional regulator n=1 Tax=Streptomyces thermolineatus TaxID=44033 RepID=A0ABP5Z9D5_9ACTN
MPPTLASLVRNPALKLTVLAGQDGLDVPVRWVHTSELDDPAPFLEGGELLLTTGLKLPDDAPGQRAYVHRLADAGVVGLGFGIGLSHEEVPGPLADAAEERGLPLLRVPQPTPFIAISKAVSAALAAEQYRAVTMTSQAQQELTRAALGPDGSRALLGRLAQRLGGWAALYDAAGGVLAAEPEWAVRRAARIAGEAVRLRERPAPAAAAVQDAADRVELQSLGTGRRARGFLAVGTERRLSPSERYVVNAAVALLTLSLEHSRTLQGAEQRLGAALLQMLLAGEAERARTVAGTMFGTLLDGPVRILVARRPARARGAAGERNGPAPAPGPGEEDGPLDALVGAVETAALRTAEHALVLHHDDRLVLLMADGGAVQKACTARLGAADGQAEEGPGDGRAEAGLAAGLSGPVAPAAAAAAHRQAEGALAVALRRGRPLVEHGELGHGSVLPLLGDEAVRAFAEGLLRPLREHDATARGDLVASLQAWLSRHGQWDAAAAELGVHRHTLRYRMRRVEELLGRSLDDPDVRMELWLALKARRDDA